jgi:hypothetical protein
MRLSVLRVKINPIDADFLKMALRLPSLTKIIFQKNIFSYYFPMPVPL